MEVAIVQGEIDERANALIRATELLQEKAHSVKDDYEGAEELRNFFVGEFLDEICGVVALFRRTL